MSNLNVVPQGRVFSLGLNRDDKRIGCILKVKETCSKISKEPCWVVTYSLIPTIKRITTGNITVYMYWKYTRQYTCYALDYNSPNLAIILSSEIQTLENTIERVKRIHYLSYNGYSTSNIPLPSNFVQDSKVVEADSLEEIYNDNLMYFDSLTSVRELVKEY